MHVTTIFAFASTTDQVYLLFLYTFTPGFFCPIPINSIGPVNEVGYGMEEYMLTRGGLREMLSIFSISFGDEWLNYRIGYNDRGKSPGLLIGKLR
jgi:hypothetical protein